jgi:hypothetical protein
MFNNAAITHPTSPPLVPVPGAIVMNDGVRKSLDDAERLMKAVEHALESSNLGIDELTVAADASGNVAVFGLATSAEVVRRASEIVQAVPGVKSLGNTIIIK